MPRLGVGVGVGVPSTGSLSAYTSFVNGFASNPAAPLAAKGDVDPDDATSAAGQINFYPRIPIFPDKKCTNGDILFFRECSANNSADWGNHSILMRRSSDNGATWGVPKTVWRDSAYDFGKKWLNLGACVIDSATGRVHLFFTYSTGTAGGGVPTSVDTVFAYYLFSDDHGATWGGAVAEDGTPLDLSASVKKQANNTTAPFDALASHWGWWQATGGCQIRNGASAGRIVFSGDHRYSNTTDVGGGLGADGISATSYSHVWYSDDNGASWTIKGLLESTAANQGTNESMVEEYGAAGALYMQCRVIGTDQRAHSRSTDFGATWVTRIADDGVSTDGGVTTTALNGRECDWSLTSMANGDLYCLGPNDSALRSNGRLWKSTNGGVTWATSKQISTKPFGYSSLLAIDPTSLLACYETTNNVRATISDGLGISFQYIEQARIPTSWLGDTTAPYTYLVFNEASSGAVPISGKFIRDHGTQQAHATGLSGGIFDANGVTTDATAAGVILADLQTDGTTKGAIGNAWDLVLGQSATIEFDLAIPAAAAGVRIVADNCNNAAGSGGWRFTLAVTTHLMTFALNDTAGHQTTAISSAAAGDDGERRRVAVVYDADASTLKMYWNGTQVGSTVSTSAMVTSLRAPQPCYLGGRQSGLNSTALTCYQARITRRALSPSEFLTGSETKPTPASLYNYTVTTPATAPSNVSGIKLWLAGTSDGGYQASKDAADTKPGYDKGVLPFTRGMGSCSYIDPISGKGFTHGASLSRGAFWDVDTTVGPHWRLSYATNAAGYYTCPSATMGTYIDSAHNTGIFSFWCAVKFISGTGGALIDNCLANASNPGITVTREDATHLRIIVSDGSGVARINSALFTGTFTNGNWYFVGVTGDASNVKLYTAAITGTYPAGTCTLGAPVTIAYSAAPGGTNASTKALGIGAYGDGSAGNADIRIKNACLSSVDVGATVMQANATFCAQY
jgi:hypothetical protein